MIEAVNAAFNDPQLRRIWVRSRVVLVCVLFVLLLYVAQRKWFWPALGVSAFGEAIQLWCFASLDKKKTLAVRGLYAVVRNPMYIGRMFLVCGYVLLTGYWQLVPAFLVLYGFYMRNRVGREEEALQAIFGEAYETYRRSVGRFLPAPASVAWSRVMFFRWRLLLQNHGLRNLAGFLASYGVVYWFVSARGQG
jgi:protein-S-isoprenylcysteine O-methyltransferase Ste14